MRRAVITGIGVISSIGNNKEEVLASLKAGKSGITYSEQFEQYNLRSRVWGNIKLDPSELIDRKVMRFMGEAAEAERRADRVEVFVPRRRAGGVEADDGSVEVELLAKMGDDPLRHGFARPDDAARMAECAKLQRKAEPIVGAPPSSDVPQLFWR